MENTVTIDCFPESALSYGRDYAVVAVDVIRATTTAVTSVAMGRRCFPAASLEESLELAKRFSNPLLAGEFEGHMPAGFEMNNSPAALASRGDLARLLVLLSSSGTRLLRLAGGCGRAYAACFRNHSAQSEWLACQRFPRVALIGAGTRGEFREEDQMCCAWIGRELVKAGYKPAGQATLDIIERWRDATPLDSLVSHSVDYLRRTGQLADLEFILERNDDLNAVFGLEAGEVVAVEPATRASGAGKAA